MPNNKTKKPKKKILLVEDEEMLVDLYTDAFLMAGYEIISSKSSEEGLQAARREKPDLILLDILLPEENGITFLRRMRKDPELAGMTVVATSNYDEAEVKKEAFSLGVKDYLIKAYFTPRELIEAVKKYL